MLFSCEDALPALVDHAADYSLGVLVLLAVCKTLVYGMSLSAFRGGPVFPAMFIGAVLGIAAEQPARHVPRPLLSPMASVPCARRCCDYP